MAHEAARTRSTIETLALASGRTRVSVDAQTRIAPRSRDAQVRQRLAGIPGDGQPRLALRPHLEIHHDQVQASHGATWGALPEDALFYLRQRGLAELLARALIVHGAAFAVLDRCLGDGGLMQATRADVALARAVARHLDAGEVIAHG
jgi:Fe-S cluster assembly protein SufD